MPIYRTQDSQKDVRLQTRWYQNDYKDCIASLLNIAKAFGFEKTYQDDVYGEFIFARKGETLDVKVVSVQKRQTAIDFQLNVSNSFDFGRSKTVIGELYQRLGKTLIERKF